VLSGRQGEAQALPFASVFQMHLKIAGILFLKKYVFNLNSSYDMSLMHVEIFQA
jgi:hypothetical protein